MPTLRSAKSKLRADFEQGNRTHLAQCRRFDQCSALFVPAHTETKEERPAPRKSPSWTVSLADAKIVNHTIEFEDRTLTLPARMKITDLSVRTHDVVFPFKGPIPVTVDHHLNETGTVSAEGKIVCNRCRPI